MIDVVIYQNSNSEYIGFKTDGHAEYDDPGQDIVCSAVSAITITILNSVEKLSDVNFTLDCDQERGAGYQGTDFDAGACDRYIRNRRILWRLYLYDL